MLHKRPYVCFSRSFVYFGGSRRSDDIDFRSSALSTLWSKAASLCMDQSSVHAKIKSPNGRPSSAAVMEGAVTNKRARGFIMSSYCLLVAYRWNSLWYLDTTQLSTPSPVDVSRMPLHLQWYILGIFTTSAHLFIVASDSSSYSTTVLVINSRTLTRCPSTGTVDNAIVCIPGIQAEAHESKYPLMLRPSPIKRGHLQLPQPTVLRSQQYYGT